MRFFFLITTLVYGLFFIGFNLGKTTEISLVVWNFEKAPTFFVVITAFILGILFTLPFLLITSSKKPQERKKPSDPAKIVEEPGKDKIQTVHS